MSSSPILNRCRDEMSRMSKSSIATAGGGAEKIGAFGEVLALGHGAFMSIQRAVPLVGPTHACFMPTGINPQAPGERR